MKMAYIAGQYGPFKMNIVFENICKARRVALKYWELGYAVICPHTNSMFMDGDDPEKTRLMFLNGDFEIIKRCDVIVMMKYWEKSRGATEELELAKKLGLEIIYEVE